MLPIWPEYPPLRQWQDYAFQRYQQHTGCDFLAVATPGAGKTTFALRVAHSLLQSQQVQQVIIVCPTEHLKKQWSIAAHDKGLEIDPYHSSGDAVLKSGFHGAAATYSQVANNSELFRHITARTPTFAILDEIHHAGDSLTWGSSIKTAFQPAVKRLALSGTPFRSDNNAIPFVNYENGHSKPDYPYTYADSLRDGVCRHIFFPKYEGKLEWISRSGILREATFSDELSEREQAERLRTAVSITGNWLRQVIRDAHERLSALRSNGHSNAGGLIIAMDQRHAEGIAEIIKDITGYTPTLAISDNPDASDHIKAFDKSIDPWIVAVKMVSEGVDIPRLRVLVYATNITSELFFRQAAGRIARIVKGLEEQGAYFYMPDDKKLIECALNIKQERDHELEELFDTYLDPRTGEILEVPDREESSSSFMPIQSEATPDGAIISSSEYSQDELDSARKIGQDIGMDYLPPEKIAHIMRMARSGTTNGPKQHRSDPDPLWQQRERLKRDIKGLVNKYALLTNLTHDAIHTQWMRMGNKSQRDPSITMDDLTRKKEWLKSQIAKWSSRE